MDTVFEFGLRSKHPRHEVILDWLAVEFMEAVEDRHYVTDLHATVLLQLGSTPTGWRFPVSSRWKWTMDGRFTR